MVSVSWSGPSVSESVVGYFYNICASIYYRPVTSVGRKKGLQLGGIEVRDLGTVTPKWDAFLKSLPSRLRDLFGRGRGKTAKAKGDR